MTTRVTEGARRERLSFFFSGCRRRFSRLAASPLNARSRARALNLKKKKDCSQSTTKISNSYSVFQCKRDMSGKISERDKRYRVTQILSRDSTE